MLEGVDDLEEDFYQPRRGGAGRVVVTIVVVAALVLVAWGSEKRYHLVEWALNEAHHGTVVPDVDARVAPLLADGERALRAGDLDASQSAFDKASVLAVGDAHVALDLSRVEAAKADIAWLTLRLIPANAADEVRVTRSALADHAALAVRDAQSAVSLKSDDLPATVAKIDGLRLAGETDAARALAVAVLGLAADPETAYVLAALEMTQGTPAWPSIVDRLRVAAAGEWSSGRAHAALVYALVKAGDLGGAQAEMTKLDALARPYPCIPDLRALLSASALLPPPAVAGEHDGGVDAAAEAGRPTRTASGQAPDDESGDTTPAGALVAANQAMGTHDFGHAEQIYQAILTSQPNDSQALSGLGDIARARGDNQGAIAAYRRAVSVNPSYLPALLGLADTQYFGGDRAAAISGYKNIEDHFPEGTYPEYVRGRTSSSP
jgi:tetratricopeptide (TPR) repeat protein